MRSISSSVRLRSDQTPMPSFLTSAFSISISSSFKRYLFVVILVPYLPDKSELTTDRTLAPKKAYPFPNLTIAPMVFARMWS